MYPDKKTMCHRTGFTKSCFECVTEHNCRAWVRITGQSAETPPKPIDLYDCADHWGPQIHQNATIELRQHLLSIAKSIDAMRKEVNETNGAALSLALQNINNRVLQVEQGTSRKLLEN